MTRLEEAKTNWDAAKASNDSESLVRASTIWQAVAEAEKAESDFHQLDRSSKSEAVRFWVPVIGASLGTVALLGTFVFSVWQFNANQRLQLQAAKANTYREAIDTITGFDPEKAVTVGVPMMKALMQSGENKAQTRDITKTLLIHVAFRDRAAFNSLFTEFVATTDKWNYRDLIDVANGLEDGYAYTYRSIREREAQASKSQAAGANGVPSGGYSGMQPGESPLGDLKDDLNSLDDAIGVARDGLLGFIRRNNNRTAPLDLSDGYFYHGSLREIDFGSSNLTRAKIEQASVARSNFGNVQQFPKSDWSGTDWWHASAISAPLFRYLRREYPYKGSPKTPAAKDYAKSIGHLKAMASVGSGKKK